MGVVPKAYLIYSDQCASVADYLKVMSEAFYGEFLEIWQGGEVIADWKRYCESAISQSDLCIIFLSGDFNRSLVAQYEMLIAIDLGKPVLCIKVEPMSAPELLADVATLNIYEYDSEDWTKDVLNYCPDTLYGDSNLLNSKRVFIAYSHKQIAIAEKLFHLIQRNRRAVFYDKNMTGGMLWRNAIQNALDEATHVIVIWTEDASNSDEVSREVNYALAEHKIVIPLVSKAIKKLPYYLHTLHYIALEDDLSEIEADLMRALGSSISTRDIWQ